MIVLPVSRSLAARNGANVWRSFDRLVDDFFPTPAPDAKASRTPALDVSETETTYVATLDLPGVSKEQVKVTINGKRVHIEARGQGHRRKEGWRSSHLSRALGGEVRTQLRAPHRG